MPGNTNTAGRSAGLPETPRERAIVALRRPSVSVPAHESGPIASNSAGASSSSAPAIAATVRSFAK